MFDEKQYQALSTVISSADFVIINGDFWDVYLTSFDRFVTSQWQRLFPLLLSKQTLYLFGNHDRRDYADQRVMLFSVQQGLYHTLQSGELVFNIRHGHLEVPEFDDLFPFITKHFGHYYHHLDFLKYGKHRFSKVTKKVDRLYRKRFHKKLLAVARKQPKNHPLLCGHTHYRSVDHAHQYINPGDFRNGWARYIEIDSDGWRAIEEPYGK